MAEKFRRHSVAVMSTSHLTSLTSDPPVQRRNRLLVDDRTPSSSKREESTVSKAVDRSNRSTKAPLSSVGVPPGPSMAIRAAAAAAAAAAATAAAATDGRNRRHSVAVHPGAAVSVMEASGMRQAAAKSSKNSSLPLKPTSSKVIDDYMEAADRALMRTTSMPSGSKIHLMATLEENVGEE